jgi:cell volume regulation protein A
MPSIEQLLLVASVLLILSILASKTSGALGVPALLVFLLIGMLAGSDGPGGIYFDDARLAQSLGVVALAVILFAGGLDTEWRSVRPVLGRALALATFGVLMTALLLGGFMSSVLGYSLLDGLLLGAIVSSTDAAAVFAVLRSRNVSLKGRLKPLLELESGSNDPMAVFLTTGLIRLITTPGASVGELAPAFVLQMTLGAAAGYGLARLMILLVNRLRLEYEGLYPVLTLSFVLLTYGATTVVGGNGFLAVYVAGLVMGHHDFIHKRSLTRFHDGLAWLMQIAMFLTLGLLVFPSRLPPVIGVGLLVSVFLMLVARPASVFLTLAVTRMPFREQAMVAWVGLRGAVPIILATFPLVAGVPRADHIFNLVFFIVLTSVLLQGTAIPVVARWLRVDAPLAATPSLLSEALATPDLKAALVELTVPCDSQAAGRQVVELGFPEGALIVLIKRGDEMLVPSGGTVVAADDILLVVGKPDIVARMRALLEPRVAPG